MAEAADTDLAGTSQRCYLVDCYAMNLPDLVHWFRRSAALLIGVALLALAVGAWRGGALETAGRSEGLVRALGERGLEADGASVLWLDHDPSRVAVLRRNAYAVVRARPNSGEPHDIYLLRAKLSPEGALLDLGKAYNLTETSGVDEQVPSGASGRFAFAEKLFGRDQVVRVRLIDLAGPWSSERPSWGTRERVQASLTSLQQTGQLRGVARVSYGLPPKTKHATVKVTGNRLELTADARACVVDLTRPEEAPDWLGVEVTPERRPGRLVNWAVDRVRAEIGDEAMQVIKAVAFSARDWVKSRKAAVSSDTGESDIAADLGEDALEPSSRTIPVDPDIGFPPPALATWVKPALAGEGQWNHKLNDPFIHHLPGLPSTFVTTFIRSDRRRKITRVYVAMWDPRLVKLNMMAGVAEPKSATGATGPGLIPREPTVMRRVAAAMNAGFQALHGEYGMMADGIVYLPPKPYAATVAALRDGSTAFGTWPNSSAIPGKVVSYRQNMTVMVLNEKFNPYKRTWWGGTPAEWEDSTHTVRTGICQTKEGFVAYFYGAELSPDALARAMILTRCKFGMALDMNAGHSGLEFYKVAPTAEVPSLGRHLRRKLEREGDVRDLPGWKFRARRFIAGMGLMNFPRYIQREGRDFFYLTLRHVLPGPPLHDKTESGDGATTAPSATATGSAAPAPSSAPAAPSGIGTDTSAKGAWITKGLPQHGFPYAMALTTFDLSPSVSARVLKLDPRMMGVRFEGEAGADKDAPVVAALNPIGDAARDPSVWWSNTAFSVGMAPAVKPAARLASAPMMGSSSKCAAIIGLDAIAGMLVYAEVIGGEGADDTSTTASEPAAVWKSLLTRLPLEPALCLERAWPIALGGDTSLALTGVRLRTDTQRLQLIRRPGAGVETLFPDTPIVPKSEWKPLQRKRIRYFKKRN